MQSEGRENSDVSENSFDFSKVFYRFGEAIFNKLQIRFCKYCDAF